MCLTLGRFGDFGLQSLIPTCYWSFLLAAQFVRGVQKAYLVRWRHWWGEGGGLGWEDLVALQLMIQILWVYDVIPKIL